MRCSLSTGIINGIDSCAAGIEMHFYPHLAFYLREEYINVLKSVLSMEKLAVGQQITLSRSVMTRKRSLVTITSTIRPGQIMNGTYNTGSPSIKLLIMIKA